MAFVGVLVDNDESVYRFVALMKDRFKDNNILSNPFKGSVTASKAGDKVLVVLSIVPVYFNFTILGWLVGAFILYFKGVHWLLIPCVILLLLGYFWSSRFYSFMMKKGFRKAGYSGDIQKLSTEEAVSLMITAMEDVTS